MDRTHRLGILLGTTLAAAVAVAVSTMPVATASVEPGTPDRDVHIGADNDNAANPFIQPPGIATPQHMSDTDVLFGRGNDDLLIGRLGNDVLLGGPGSDILAGGPGQPGQSANGGGNDVMVGDDGADIGIWSVGDGNDVFAGNDGSDTMVVGRLVTGAAGAPVLTTFGNRTIPKVDLSGSIDFRLVPVPESEGLGVQYLLRVAPYGAPVSTIRLKDVERVVLPAERTAPAGSARVADLTGAAPVVTTVPVASIGGLTGAIVAPASQGR